ncbi:MAG: TRM11 family SAM-dependent methyltransferase [Tumebacillaceae bacterium]
MATPAYAFQIPSHSLPDGIAGAQLELLSPLLNDSPVGHEVAGTFALSSSPKLMRSLIHAHSQPGDTVLDPFVGSGTTYLEAKLMGRHPIGIDCNPALVDRVRHHHLFAPSPAHLQELYCADAQDLSAIVPTESVDLIVTQPPYGSTFKFSRNNPHDLSLLTSQNFLKAIEQVASEMYRVLKPDGICAILIGDVKDNGRMMPLGFQFIHRFLSSGFSVKESYDHRTPSTLLPVPLYANEYLFIFQKKQKAPKRPRMTN